MKLLQITRTLFVAFALTVPLAPCAALADTSVSDFFVGQAPTQMYVQHWNDTERKTSGAPLILIHGGAHSGICWTTTPDGRPGWAVDFARAGRDVYVVDWPGVGRSGFWPTSVEVGPRVIVEQIVKLLEKTGPAVLVGHSIGGTLALKTAEARPDLVKAVVALSVGAVETPLPDAKPAPEGQAIVLPREPAMHLFAASPTFPKENFDDYYNSFQPVSPRITNAVSTVTDDLKLDRNRLAAWSHIPVLFLAADEDRVALPERTAVTAQLIKADQIMLGADWGLQGHGHMSMLETGSELISAKVVDWMKDK